MNTSFSSVHIPTNVYDKSPPVAEDIRKTENLDNVFRQNYESDPALSWQYFGSVTGMLRQYPAMQWRTGLTENNEALGDEDEGAPGEDEDGGGKAINIEDNESARYEREVAEAEESSTAANTADNENAKEKDEEDEENEDDEEDEQPADIYDCRVRSWFIEAATCSKDMVILMDTSGSMTGMGKTIGDLIQLLMFSGMEMC